MKRTEMSFAEGFLGIQASIAKSQGKPMMAFDWDKAAEIIKRKFLEHPDLIAEAGLQGDWAHTAGCIFENGKPVSNDYTYLSSNWASPTLILSWDGEEQEEIECSCVENKRFNSDSKWDKVSLKILRIKKQRSKK